MKENVIYLLRLGPCYKLGRASRWETRWKSYQAYSPFKLRFIFAIPVPDPRETEAYLLRLYRRQIVDGKKEWMTLTRRHVWRIKRYLLRLNRRTKPFFNPSVKGLSRSNPVWDTVARLSTKPLAIPPAALSELGHPSSSF